MKRFDQINVIPFIDIMLVMLAIVLTTASFISQGIIKVDLPETISTSPVSNETKIEISITETQQVFFAENIISLKDLGEKLHLLEPETLIILRVDKKVDFGTFLTVVDILKAKKLENLSILTRQAHESS